MLLGLSLAATEWVGSRMKEMTRIITYSLKANAASSDEYYQIVAVFASAWLEESQALSAELVSGFRTFRETRGEAERSATRYSAWSEVRTFTTGNPPSVPALSAPANNAFLTCTAQPTFEWANSTLPTGTIFRYYEYHIDTTNTFATAATFITTPGDINDSNRTPPTAEFPVFKRANTYDWRVRVWYTVNDYSGWSAVFRFRIAYEAPALISPINGGTLSTLKPTFTWNAVLGATSYKIQVSTGPNFGTTVVNLTVSLTTYMRTTSLISRKAYYWRVQALGPYGPSAWSVVWTFITP